MAKKILLTGGAGFVGSHTAEALLTRGHQVKVFDNLSQQAHQTGLPEYLSPEIEFVEGDIRDLESLREAVNGVAIIYHFAASVEVGQAMYDIADHTAVTVQDTAN